MTGFTAYRRLERTIATADTGVIRARWEYGRRLLCDRAATTPDGDLLAGVLAGLIEAARKAGEKLTEEEIRRRIQLGATYPCDSQITEICARYDSWEALRAGEFPAVAPADGDEPHDPRTAIEKARSVEKQLAFGEPADPSQLTLFDYFPPERFDEHTTLAELAKYADESAEWTARHARKDEARAEYLKRLINAAGGNLAATWEQAQAALDAS
jgi:hypothetical protein